MLDLTASYMQWVIGGLVAAGLFVFFLPAYKPIWAIEAAMWGLVLGLLLMVLSLAQVFWYLSPWIGLALFLAAVGYIAYWLVPSNRRYEVLTEAVVDAPPQKVFESAIDLSYFHPVSSQARVESVTVVGNGGEMGKGVHVVTRLRASGLRLEGVDLITEFDPPRVYADETLGTNSTVRFTFEPRGSGTSIRVQSNGELSIPNAVLTGMMKKSVIERMRKSRVEWLDGIRNRVAR
jgi:hypothetical protein